MDDNENMIGMEETPETVEQQEDSFLGGWDETETDLGDGPAPEEDPEPQDETLQEEGPAGEPTGEETAPQDNAEPQAADAGQKETPPQPPRAWNIQHEGKAVTVNERDAPGLMEKGLAFEKLQREQEELRPAISILQRFAGQAGLSMTEYVARLRAQEKQAGGLSPEEAKRAVELEDREARLALQEARERQRQEALESVKQARARDQERIAQGAREFMQVYPEAARDYQNIPQEVWDAVNAGASLVAAYTGYVNRQNAAQAKAREEANAKEEAVRAKNQDNAARSTGSMRSAGGDRNAKDPFAQGFDEG